jgi:hypothetical protein
MRQKNEMLSDLFLCVGYGRGDRLVELSAARNGGGEGVGRGGWGGWGGGFPTLLK